MIGRLRDLTMNRNDSQNITVTVETDFREMYEKLKDCDVVVEIKKASPKRSQNANQYLWHLCSEIAKASSRFSTDGKNDVYREAIKAKGEFEPLLVRDDAVEKFLARWSEHGTGWFAEVVDSYKDRYKIVHAFYGSSTYDSASMSRVIDYLVLIANDLGIPTITETATTKMLEAWAHLKDEGE